MIIKRGNNATSNENNSTKRGDSMMNESLKKILDQLNENEKQQIPLDTNINITDIIPVLLRRVTPENVDTLASLLKHSIVPSIYSDEDLEFEQLFHKIEGKPTLLFDKDIQDEIDKFIRRRFEKDKEVIIERTSDISKFIVLMGRYLNDTIELSGNSSQNVLEIKEKIEKISIDVNDTNSLFTFQQELVEASVSMQNEMGNVTNKLEEGKVRVDELEQKVKSLEDELTKAKQEVRTDPLTGLLTRRAYEDEIKKIESLYVRNNIEYAIVFFDLDYFKKINDSYGHKCGDIVLSTFGKILKKYTRDHDIISRYGGEEFVAIVNFNLLKELMLYLKRIKAVVTQNKFVCPENKIAISFSAGVSIRSSYDSYEEAIQQADKLLYKAKETGRNKIVIENGNEL